MAHNMEISVTRKMFDKIMPNFETPKFTPGSCDGCEDDIPVVKLPKAVEGYKYVCPECLVMVEDFHGPQFNYPVQIKA